MPKCQVELLNDAWLDVDKIADFHLKKVDAGVAQHNFNCTDANDMNFGLMAERTRYLKENPKGVSEMCRAMEDMRTQERKETMIEIAFRMLRAGRYALEEIVNISGLSLDEVKNLQTNHNA